MKMTHEKMIELKDWAERSIKRSIWLNLLHFKPYSKFKIVSKPGKIVGKRCSLIIMDDLVRENEDD